MDQAQHLQQHAHAPAEQPSLTDQEDLQHENATTTKMGSSVSLAVDDHHCHCCDEEPPIAADLPHTTSSDDVVAAASAANPLRWVVLVAVCTIMASNSYSYDIPAALHQQLKDYMENQPGKAPINFEFEFSLLYTVYSIPNVVLPFFGGTIIDKIGPAKCLPVFVLLCCIGQVVVSLGTTHKAWSTMLAGRLIYGLGGECVYVACATVLSSWFRGKELGFAFALAMAMCRMGSVTNNWISPVVAISKSTQAALWVGSIVNLVGLAISILLLFLQRCQHRNNTDAVSSELQEPLLNEIEDGFLFLQANTPDATQSGIDTANNNNDAAQESSERRGGAEHAHQSKRLGPLFWLLAISCFVVYGCILPFNNILSGLLLERNYFKSPPFDCTLAFPDQCTSGTLAPPSNPSTDSYGQSCPGPNYAPILPSSLNWTNAENSKSALAVDCDSSFWSDDCTKDYCAALKTATLTAGRAMSIPYLAAAVLAPILGMMVDRVGRRSLLASLAPAVLVLVHLILAYGQGGPLMPLLGQGICCALFGAVLWPSVPLTVSKALEGTAFGVINAIQNVGLVLFPPIVATLHSKSNGKYLPNVELFFVGCACAGSLVGLLLHLQDRKTGGRLDSIDGNGKQNDNNSMTTSNPQEESNE